MGRIRKNGGMELKDVKCPSQSSVDALLRIRPGAFRSNSAILLKLLGELSAQGCKTLVLPPWYIAGGDCGSLENHPVFIAALKKTEASFRRSYAVMKNAPKLAFKGGMPKAKPPKKLKRQRLSSLAKGKICSLVKTFIMNAGPDPRFPFGGRPEEVFTRQVTGLAGRIAAIGCRNVVIGLSGGLDSALALLVISSAFKLLGLDRKGIHVFAMPGFGTTKRTRSNAGDLAAGLGLKLETIDITAACRLHFKDIGHDPGKHDVTFENVQARERTQILMDKANQLNGIVIGTGDMSEIALGWSTYNGDHISMFNVNAGVPKTVVREVCRWWAENNPGTAADALCDIIATPVSPELLPSKKGKIVQKTEDKIGPYELHDFFMWHFTAENESPRQILAAAKKAFRGIYDAQTIGKWLEVFLKRIHSQAFKRNCAPDGVRVYGAYFGPEAWHVPSDISDEWLYI